MKSNNCPLPGKTSKPSRKQLPGFNLTYFMMMFACLTTEDHFFVSASRNP
jgi:hypothetical protein